MLDSDVAVVYNKHMKKKRTNIYIDERDKASLQVIREAYNLDSDAAAVRFALHRVANEVKVPKK